MLVNIATGSEYHKQSIMKRHAILRSILGLMSHGAPTVRVAAIWVVINLTWQDDKTSTGVHDRVLYLRNMGMEDRLRIMNTDQNLDVRDRVKTALHQFAIDQQHHAHTTHGLSEATTTTTTTTTTAVAGTHGRLSAQSPHRSTRSNDPQEGVAMVTDSNLFGGGDVVPTDAAQAITGGPGATSHERR